MIGTAAPAPAERFVGYQRVLARIVVLVRVFFCMSKPLITRPATPLLTTKLSRCCSWMPHSTETHTPHTHILRRGASTTHLPVREMICVCPRVCHPHIYHAQSPIPCPEQSLFLPKNVTFYFCCPFFYRTWNPACFSFFGVRRSACFAQLLVATFALRPFGGPPSHTIF